MIPVLTGGWGAVCSAHGLTSVWSSPAAAAFGVLGHVAAHHAG